MFGIASIELAIAYLLCIASALWCVVYALYLWEAKGRDAEVHKEQDWAKHNGHGEANPIVEAHPNFTADYSFSF